MKLVSDARCAIGLPVALGKFTTQSTTAAAIAAPAPPIDRYGPSAST